MLFGDHLIFVVIFRESTKLKFINETFFDALVEVTSVFFLSDGVKSCQP